jgi:hypothetical protein
VRDLWLAAPGIVVAADVVDGDAIEEVAYHWHGHADGAWWVEEGWARITLNGATLWFTSPQMSVTQEGLVRLPGSKGPLTLTASATPPESPVWWVLAFGETPPDVETAEGGTAIQVKGRRFALG